MQIVVANPPNIEALEAAFPAIRGRPVIFCWGETIYNPKGIELGPELIAHERVHSERQGRERDSIVDWWTRYIDDALFRYEEELLAHRAEYQHMRRETRDRNAKAGALDSVARKLAHPIYGGVTTYQKARRAIAAERSP